MHLAPFLQFLTFVVLALSSTCLFAAPTSEVHPNEYRIKNGAPSSEGKIDQDTIQVTPQQKPPDSWSALQASRTVRDLTWNIGIGRWSGTIQDQKGLQELNVITLSQTRTSLEEKSLEYGVHLTTEGTLGPHLKYKKYCCYGAWAEPYWTVGVAGLYQPSQLFAHLIKLGSYQIQGGGGFEDLFRQKRRFRVEALISEGLYGPSIFVQLGYAFDEDFLRF